MKNFLYWQELNTIKAQRKGQHKIMGAAAFGQKRKNKT